MLIIPSYRVSTLMADAIRLHRVAEFGERAAAFRKQEIKSRQLNCLSPSLNEESSNKQFYVSKKRNAKVDLVPDTR
jgi:hypothetical protein